MKIIAQGKAKLNKNKIRKEAIEMRKTVAMAVIVSLIFCISNAYALIDQKNRNLVIAEQEYQGANSRLLNQGTLMIKQDFEILNKNGGDLR